MTTEKTIKKQILVRLSELGVFAWNNPVGLATPLKAQRPIQFGLPGTADILGIMPDGRGIGVETKSRTGRQRNTQKKWQRRWERNKGLYIIARSVEQLEQALQSAGYQTE